MDRGKEKYPQGSYTRAITKAKELMELCGRNRVYMRGVVQGIVLAFNLTDSEADRVYFDVTGQTIEQYARSFGVRG